MFWKRYSYSHEIKMESKKLNFIKCCFCVAIISYFICTASSAEILTRKRRYVVFPDGSTVQVLVEFLKGLPFNLPIKWNVVVGEQLDFLLPNSTRTFNALPHHAKHRHDRSAMLGLAEKLLNKYGLDGRACVLRAVCESQWLLRPSRSLRRELLHVLLRFPPQESYSAPEPQQQYQSAYEHEDCHPWADACPLSLVSALLQSPWDLPRSVEPAMH